MVLRREYPGDKAKKDDARRRRRRRRRAPLDAPSASTLVDLSETSAAARITARETPTHRVYTREHCTDDWTEEPHLWCSEAVWSVAPAIPSATIHYDYGLIAQPEHTHFANYIKRGVNRLYVEVKFDLERDPLDTESWLSRNWTGVIELNEDQLGGVAYDTLEQADDETNRVETTYYALATGRQTFIAYGMEYLLTKEIVAKSYWQDGVGDAANEIDRALVFNRDGKPNMHSEDVGNGVHHFAADVASAEFWSTRDIVVYLLNYFSPTTRFGITRIEFTLDALHSVELPDWDSPELAAEGRTVHDLLCSLISRQRLLSWCSAHWSPEELVVFSFSARAIAVVLAAAGRVPANDDRIRLAFDEDPSSVATLKTTTIDAVDQIIMRGARRRSVASFSIEDGTLALGWSAALETDYEAGASGSATYPAATDKKGRRERNREYRNRPEWEDVFSRFAIPDDWNYYAGDGLGGSNNPVFPIYDPGEDDPGATPYKVYPIDLVVEPTMPLIKGVDYSDSAIEDGDFDEDASNGEERPPFVAWAIPSTSPQRYRDLLSIGLSAPQEIDDDKQNFVWSADVNAISGDRAVRIRVLGAPRHVIAYTDFSGLTEDEDLGGNDYRDMIVTLSLPDDRYAEGRYPSDDALDANLDSVRRRTIRISDRYRVDYVCPQTVVDINDKGELVRSDGGLVHDDRKLLEQAARISYEWYKDERRVLILETERLTDSIKLGSLIVEIGSRDKDPEGGHYVKIDSAVTEIRIMTPEGTAASPPPGPRMRITTAAGELDAVRLLEEPLRAVEMYELSDMDAP